MTATQWDGNTAEAMTPVDIGTEQPPGLLGRVSGTLALRLCNTSRAGQVVLVPLPKSTVGGSRHCEVYLPDAGLDPCHCLLLRGSQATVVRRWSPHTRLNGAEFESACLRQGDRLSLGPVDLEVVDCDHPEPGHVIEQRLTQQISELQRLLESSGLPAAPLTALPTAPPSTELQALCEQLQTESQQLRTELAEAQLYCQQVAASRDELQARGDALENQRDEHARRLVELQTERDQLDRQRAELEADRQQMLEQHAQWQSQCERLQAQRDELEAACDQQRARCQELESHLQQLQQSLQQHTQQLDAVHADHSQQDTNRDLIEQLNYRVVQLTEECRDKESLLAALRFELSGLQAAHQQAEQSLCRQAGLERELAEVREQLEERTEQWEQAETRWQQADAERQQAEVEWQKAKAECEQAKAELQQADAERQQVKSEWQQAEAERQQAEAVRQQVEAELQQSEAERQQVEAARQRAEAERQQIEAELQQVAAVREQVEAELQRSEAERQQAEAARQRAEAERQQVEAELQRIEAERRHVEAELQQAEAARQQSEAELQQAEAARQQAEAEWQAERQRLERAAEEAQREAGRLSAAPTSGPLDTVRSFAPDTDDSVLSADHIEVAADYDSLELVPDGELCMEADAEDVSQCSVESLPQRKTECMPSTGQREPAGPVSAADVLARWREQVCAEESMAEEDAPASAAASTASMLAVKNDAAHLGETPSDTRERPMQDDCSDEDDSIQEYLGRLLNRVRGRDDDVNASAVREVVPGVTCESVSSDSFRKVAEPREYVQRVAPEQQMSLQAMRQLANDSAQSALETHEQRQRNEYRRSAWTLAVYGAFWGTAAWVLLRDYQTWLAVTAAFFGFALSGVMLVAGYLRRIPWSKAAD